MKNIEWLHVLIIIDDGIIINSQSEFLFDFSDELLKRDTDGEVSVELIEQVSLSFLFCSDLTPDDCSSGEVEIH